MTDRITTQVDEAHGVKIGDLFTDHVQPYGSRTIRIERIEQVELTQPRSYCASVWHNLSGTVTDGNETSRLFQHSSTRSIVGHHHTAYGCSPHDLTKGSKVTAICG